MKNKGGGIIEMIVVVTILSIGMVGSQFVLNSGIKLATVSENRIRAINIAKEGLEAAQNIRDTNWIKFSSDYNHCWNVLDYNQTCVGAADYSRSIPNNGSYLLYQDGYLWKLSPRVAPADVNDIGGYISAFPVYLDASGNNTQSGVVTTQYCSSTKNFNCKTIFGRQIIITYPVAPNNPSAKQMKIESIVKWVDSSKKDPYILRLDTILTNWKEDL